MEWLSEVERIADIWGMDESNVKEMIDLKEIIITLNEQELKRFQKYIELMGMDDVTDVYWTIETAVKVLAVARCNERLNDFGVDMVDK